MRGICTNSKQAHADPLRDFSSLFSTTVFYCPYSREDDQSASICHQNAAINALHPGGHQTLRFHQFPWERQGAGVVNWNLITTQQRQARRPAPFSPHSVFRVSQYGLWCVSLRRISAIPVNKWSGEMPVIAWALAGTMLAVRPHDGYSLMIHFGMIYVTLLERKRKTGCRQKDEEQF